MHASAAGRASPPIPFPHGCPPTSNGMGLMPSPPTPHTTTPTHFHYTSPLPPTHLGFIYSLEEALFEQIVDHCRVTPHQVGAEPRQQLRVLMQGGLRGTVTGYLVSGGTGMGVGVGLGGGQGWGWGGGGLEGLAGSRPSRFHSAAMQQHPCKHVATNLPSQTPPHTHTPTPPNTHPSTHPLTQPPTQPPTHPTPPPAGRRCGQRAG
jgi:hypothetical protein